MNIVPNSVRSPFPRSPLARLDPPLRPINQAAGFMLRRPMPPGRFLRPRQFLKRPPLEKIVPLWFWLYALAHAAILVIFFILITRP